jgi:hypothetical protein
MGEPREESTDGVRSKKRADPIGADRPWQTAEQGDKRSAQPQERRHDHHQQHVLHHVDLQKERSERLDR